MAEAIGTVKSISGKFFVKDIDGNVIALKVGDTITKNMIVYGDSSDANLEIAMNDGTESLSIQGMAKQTIDGSVIENELIEEALATQSVDEVLDPTLLADEKTQKEGEENEEETAAGEDTPNTTELGEGQFFDVFGNQTDILATLRDARFPDGEIPREPDGEPLLNAELNLTGLTIVPEGDTAVYTLSVDRAPITDLNITLSLSHIDTDTGDIIEKAFTVTIPSGETSVTFKIDNIDNYYYEENEDYNVAITGTNGGGYDRLDIGTKSIVTTILDDGGTINIPNDGPEPTHEVVQIKLVACDENGKPIMDGNKYTFTNEVNEDDAASYMVLAFLPGVTEYTTATKLPDSEQVGTVTISTKDLDAMGTTAGEDMNSLGDKDYVTTTTKEVALGKSFKVDTHDDRIADNGEFYNVKIDANSYKSPPAGDFYENVSVDGVVKTKIIDNTNTTPVAPPGIDKPEDSREDTIIKLVACDSAGKPIIKKGAYTFINEVNEDDAASYMALAFDSTNTTFLKGSELNLQLGSVTVSTTDGDSAKNANVADATGTSAGENMDSTGDKDYVTTSTKQVDLGVAFSIDTHDDRIADNNEFFNVSIDANSYKAEKVDGTKTPAYENVKEDGLVDTKIIDDTGTPTVAPDGPETDHEVIYAKISQNDIVAEGQGNILTHKVELYRLEDDGNGGTKEVPVVVPVGESITINLAYPTASNKTQAGDFTKPLTTSVVINGGSSSAIFTNTVKDDNSVENSESYSVKIRSVGNHPFENVIVKDVSVTGTIIDFDKAVKEDDSNKKENGDFDITILGNLNSVYKDAEFISIKISGIPSDATLKGTFVDNNDGTYTVTGLANALALTVTPALDSSTDMNLSFEVTLSDNSTENFAQKITINPEADQPYTLGSLGYDEKDYGNVVEDSGWINLTGITANVGESGANHISETLRDVRFSGVGPGYDIPVGSQIRYQKDNGDWVTKTFSSSDTKITIPADKIATVEFKTPKDFNGDVNIKIETRVKDTDEDNSGRKDNNWSDNFDHDNDGTASYQQNNAWGVADKLKLTVTGSADLSDHLFTVMNVEGLEDTGRNQETGALTQNPNGTYDISKAIALKIDFKDSKYTDTEIIKFELQGIVKDAYVFDSTGKLLNDPTVANSSITVVLDPSNSYTPANGEIKFNSISAFRNYVENLKLIPPHDSNEDFTLTVKQTATEPSYDANVGGVQTVTKSEDIQVILNGVADAPVISGTDTPVNLIESGSWQDMTGFKIASGEEQHHSEKVYAIFKNLPNEIGLRVVDANGVVQYDKLVLGKVSANATDWRIDNDTLEGIKNGTYKLQIKTPDADMSGKLSLDVKVTVLDYDNDNGQPVASKTVNETIKFSVKPKIETYDNTTVSGNEDTWINLGLSVKSKDGDMLVEDKYSFNGNDYDLKIEFTNGIGTTAENVQVQGTNLVIDYANNTVYLNKADLSSVEVLAPKHSNVDLSGIKLHKTIKDDMDDSSTIDTNENEVITTHNVKIKGVADGWDENGYDGFQVQDVTVSNPNNLVSLNSEVITKNVNVEDNYHNGLTPVGTDNSESEYYIIQNKSGVTDNTNWIVENGINAGNGIWVVPASKLANANVKIIQPNAGDGTLNLEIIPVSKENDGNIKFDPAHPFTINYAGGPDSITGVDGNGNLKIDNGGTPLNLSTNSKTDGLEDQTVTDVFNGTSANNGAKLSYLVPANATNGSLDTSGMYQLPNGSFIGTGTVDFNPTKDFNGDVGFNATVIATQANGNQVFKAENVTIDIDPQLDGMNISADNGTETNGEAIALNLSITSKDTDSSESLSGNVTITAKSGGEFIFNGVTTTTSTITVAANEIGNVQYIPPRYKHGKFDFDVTYTKLDSDANENNNDISATVTESFSIKLASQVDDIEVTLANNTVNEGQAVPLNISLNQHDDDGSEIASVVISGIPDALVIQNAAGKQVGTYELDSNGKLVCVLKGAEVTAGGLKLYDATGTFSGTYNLSIKAFSFDKETREISTDSDSATITINPLASAIKYVDAGGVNNDEIIANEGDKSLALDLDVTLSDLDGSEKIQLEFVGLPNGFNVVYGINNTPVTSKTYLTPLEAQTVKLVPPAGYKGNFNLDINVKSVDFDNNGNLVSTLATAVTETVNVTVNPVTNDATLTINDSTADRTTGSNEYALDISANVSDSSQSLHVILKDVQGTLNNGTYNASTKEWTLSTANLTNLKVTPNSDVTGDFNIKVKAVTQDGTAAAKETAEQTITVKTGENESLEYNGTNSVDGFAGEDIISLSSGTDLDTLDFSKLDNIEEIDLTSNGQHNITNLKLSDVINMTDGDNDLIITGDAADSVDAITNDLDMSEWTKTEVDNGTSTTYEYSKNDGSNSISLTVDDNINNTGL